MPNTYTSTAADSLGTDLVQTAYDRLIRFELRSTPLFRAFADSRPEQQAHPGDSVVFQFYNDLNTATSELTETLDVDAVGVPSTSNVSVTLREYGNAVLVTRKLQLLSLSDVDAGISNMVAYNLRDSIDEIVSPVLRGGTHVIRRNSAVVKSDLIAAGAGTTNAVTSTDTMTSALPRLGVTKLRGNKVIPRNGDLYVCLLHPDVSHDLRAETGGAAWRDPHNLGGQDAIWQGNIGIYEGAYYIETPRIYNTTDGSTSARVYRNLIMGREALAEAVAEEPGIVFGNVTDKLMRFRPIGWKGTIGWSRFREDALIRIETASSVAA